MPRSHPQAGSNGAASARRACAAGRIAPGPLRVLVAGVGNLLLGDDGVGVHAIHLLQREPILGVTMVEIGTAILHGLDFVESADRVLLIDAAQGGRAPGTIYLFDASQNTETRAVTSIHAMGLREAVRFLSRGQPPPITVIGVEPQNLDYGMELSAPLRAALPQVVALARETVLAWTQRLGFGAKTAAQVRAMTA
jgi:hydrogenase maturation protease